MSAPQQPYKAPLPHPAKVVPKVGIIIFVILLFIHLFWNLGRDKQAVPHPVRVSLVHAEKGWTGEEALRSGMTLISPLDAVRTPRGVRFDLPLGSQHGALTYNARAFREENHLGDDLNGIGGQNSDLGDPIYAAGDGLVVYAATASPGWGNLIIVEHRPEGKTLFQTFYAHLDRMDVGVGEKVLRGQQIGTVGTANGQYLAHLHLECRDSLSLDIGGGYAPFALGRMAPENYLNELRGTTLEDLSPSFALLKKDLGTVPDEVELKAKVPGELDRFELDP